MTDPGASKFGDTVRCTAGCGAILCPYEPGAAEDQRTEQRLRESGWNEVGDGLWKCPSKHPEDWQPGDWVKVKAQIVELHPNQVDLSLELFSKTDQYTAFVRRDLCEPTDKPMSDEPGEGSVALLDGDAFQRLEDEWRPANNHGSYLSWSELNRRGDVVVIHRA